MTFSYTHGNDDVESSAVYEAYYDAATRRLAVVLEGGSGYVYKNVPKSVYDVIANGTHIGRYYNTTVKRQYGPAEYLGYVGYENEQVFVKGVEAPDMGSTVGTPKGLTYAPGVTATDGGGFAIAGPLSPSVLTLTSVDGNTDRTFNVTFEVGDKTRSHTLKAESFGAAEAAVLEIGAMLDLTFEVKEISVV